MTLQLLRVPQRAKHNVLYIEEEERMMLVSARRSDD
jgi:hypothetical protein